MILIIYYKYLYFVIYILLKVKVFDCREKRTTFVLERGSM
jgi:hypothetical protein